MAYYIVTAKPKPERLEVLREKLQEHAYESVRPFGRAMTHSQENAMFRENCYAAWEKEGFCMPPLA